MEWHCPFVQASLPGRSHGAYPWTLSSDTGRFHDHRMLDHAQRAARARKEAPAPRARAAEHSLLALQRAAGNAAVSSLVAGLSVQRIWPFDDDEEEDEGPEDVGPEEEEDGEETPEPEEDEEPEEAPDDDDAAWQRGAGGIATLVAAVRPGTMTYRLGPKDEGSSADRACYNDPLTWSSVRSTVAAYPIEHIPPDSHGGGSGTLSLTIAPFTGQSVVLQDSLDLFGRQVARRWNLLPASPEVDRIYNESVVYKEGGEIPKPGGGGAGGGGAPGGPGGGGAPGGPSGPGGIPGMEPVAPGGGPAGPGGIPGMEPVTPGGGVGGEAPARPMLRKGSAGDDVRHAQELLVRHGAAIDPDGDFGSRTQRAVIEFQQSAALGADGIVGPLTWTALEAA